MEMNRQIINSYMFKNNVDQELKYQIREYLDFYWKETSI